MAVVAASIAKVASIAATIVTAVDAHRPLSSHRPPPRRFTDGHTTCVDTRPSTRRERSTHKRVILISSYIFPRSIIVVVYFTFKYYFSVVYLQHFRPQKKKKIVFYFIWIVFTVSLFKLYKIFRAILIFIIIKYWYSILGARYRPKGRLTGTFVLGLAHLQNNEMTSKTKEWQNKKWFYPGSRKNL